MNSQNKVNGWLYWYFYSCLFPPQLIRKRTDAIERVKHYLSDTIAEHKLSFDSENIRDFIDLYIKASKDESEPKLYTGNFISKPAAMAPFSTYVY